MNHLASGSCLCGAVTFQISGRFESFFLCHCSRCRKDTGSAHAANLFSIQAEIVWLRGEDKVRTFQLPGTRHAKSFCMECGSALPMVQMQGALLIVPAGSLDGPIDVRPNAHICYGSRAEWTDRLASAEKIDGLPAQPA
ncbi:GFA family protein [Afifella sp. IM 167]|uniref:GFA family protein n=1 Tax=Afifella sp. IM 167 TaxID=2033586 RepID=UPI001CC9451F|nr:GFA family protein [Afifella sp. IM 167]MBZ8134498.1 aldehyde-activating protein [Afifella sp. IM 167]